MANTTTPLVRDFVPRDSTMPTDLWPTQAQQTIYDGSGVTRDASGNVGTYAAGEALAGIAAPDVPHKDRTLATAAQAGKDVQVVSRGFMLCTVTGASAADIGKAVFMSDDQTFTYTPSAGALLGEVVYYDKYKDQVVVQLKPGSAGWSTQVTLADDAEIDLPAQAGLALITGGGESAVVQITAAGAVTLVANTTNVAATDSDGNLCIYDAGANASLKNALGQEESFAVQFIGVAI